MNKKYHVTYWAYNPIMKLNYIGVKSFNNFSEFENYNTSSSNKIFKSIKLNKYIIKWFNSREESINYEIKLHFKFNVDKNKKFANIVKQTNKKFDTTNKSPWNKGIPCTKDTKRKISNANKGKKRTEETKKLMSISKKGINNGMYNKNHSKETKLKISSKLLGIPNKYKGKKWNEITSKKHPMIGRNHSNKTKEKMSKSRKGKYKGENNPRSILNNTQVKIIKYLLKNSSFKQTEIADIFKVKRQTIYQIKNNIIYK